MRRLGGSRSIAAVLATLAAVGAAAGAFTLAVSAANASVAVADNRFEPRQVTINTGDKVTWTFTGNAPHSVTADDGSFDSHPGCSGSNFVACSSAASPPFERTFTQPGTFSYHCKIHGGPGGSGMSGVVVVNATASPTAPTTAAPTTAAPTTARPSTTRQPTTTAAATSTSTTTDDAAATSSTSTSSTSTSSTTIELAADDISSDDGGVGVGWIALGALLALAVAGYAGYQLIQARRAGGV